jgi:hypothetical protein
VENPKTTHQRKTHKEPWQPMLLQKVDLDPRQIGCYFSIEIYEKQCVSLTFFVMLNEQYGEAWAFGS